VDRKAQAALEYLKTYSWALLAIIIIFLILYSMINIVKLPQHCIFDDPGMSCSQAGMPALTKDAFFLARIDNNLQQGMIIKGTLCTRDVPKHLSYDDPRTFKIIPNLDLGPGQGFMLNDYKVQCYCGDQIVDLEQDRFDGHLYIWYNYKSDLDDYEPRFYHARFSVDVLNAELGTSGDDTDNQDQQPDDLPVTCGNNICDDDETIYNCPADCRCNNDGNCDAPYENPVVCPGDCGYCGNKVCDEIMGETAENCPEDCHCGNGVCEKARGENQGSCPADCSDEPDPPVCGDPNNNCGCNEDTVCQPLYGEKYDNCPDCIGCSNNRPDNVCKNTEWNREFSGSENVNGKPARPNFVITSYCEDCDCNENNICETETRGETVIRCALDCSCNSDGICDSPMENHFICKQDCGCNDNAICEPERLETYKNCKDCRQSQCGNGVCDRGETFQNCPEDCYCGNGRCDPGEIYYVDGSKPNECKECGYCGDGSCEIRKGETQDNCPEDCGYCGDNICQYPYERPSRDNIICEQDCPGFCGDNICQVNNKYGYPFKITDIPETYYIDGSGNQCKDCGYCGDNICQLYFEDYYIDGSGNECKDCGYCGDGLCHIYNGEDVCTCYEDCN